MANLSITQAWNETAAFIKREARLVLPIALLLVALPGALLQIVMPATVPGQPPEPGLWLLLVPFVVIASMIGTVAITYLALRPGASVEEALRVGARRFIMLFAASLLVAIGLSLVMVPLLLVAGGAAMMSGGSPQAVAGPVVLVVLIFVVVAIAVSVKLMMMTPVTAAETGGPIEIIRRSWQLTAGHFWKLLGFLVLLIIAAIVVIFAISAVFAILLFVIAGRPDPGSVSMMLLSIFIALLRAVLVAIFATFVARIYARLTGGAPEKVFT